MAAKSASDVMTEEEYFKDLDNIWSTLTPEQRRGFRSYSNAFFVTFYGGADKLPALTQERLAKLKEPGTC